MDEKTASVGDRIREERLRKGIGQADLARSVGVTPAFIWRIEFGSRSPSRELSMKLASALGLTLDYLLRGHDFENAPTIPVPRPREAS